MNTSTDDIVSLLSLPDKFTFIEFTEGVQSYINKKIALIPWAFPPEITSACLQSEKSIYVFFAIGLSPIHQTLVLLHELVHVILPNEEHHQLSVEEQNLFEAIMQVNQLYDKDKINDIVLRSITSLPSETKIDTLASELLNLITPERKGNESSLAKMNVD